MQIFIRAYTNWVPNFVSIIHVHYRFSYLVFARNIGSNWGYDTPPLLRSSRYLLVAKLLLQINQQICNMEKRFSWKIRTVIIDMTRSANFFLVYYKKKSHNKKFHIKSVLKYILYIIYQIR